MDFMTFADSALALGPCFEACAREGLERGAADPAWAGASCSRTPVKPEMAEGYAAETRVTDTAFLAALRTIGIEGERRMFTATGGINTHKGALFLVGLQVAAAGALVGAGIPPTANRTRLLAARVANGVSERELPSAATNGAVAFRAFGTRGIRGEAESALQSLDGGALDLLVRVTALRDPNDEDCVNALLQIMACAEDTTVLHRGGQGALRLVQEGARLVLEAGGMTTPAGRSALANFSTALVSRRVSPGGSADLLAAALFLSDIERSFVRNAVCPPRIRRRHLAVHPVPVEHLRYLLPIASRNGC